MSDTELADVREAILRWAEANAKLEEVRAQPLPDDIAEQTRKVFEMIDSFAGGARGYLVKRGHKIRSSNDTLKVSPRPKPGTHAEQAAQILVDSEMLRQLVERMTADIEPMNRATLAFTVHFALMLGASVQRFVWLKIATNGRKSSDGGRESVKRRREKNAERDTAIKAAWREKQHLIGRGYMQQSKNAVAMGIAIQFHISTDQVLRIVGA